MYILIPAKLNSSRFYRKNLRKIYNKSLIELTIEFAKSLKIKKKIFISSESKKILNIAKFYNCETILRPKSLSRKNTEMKLVIDHFIKKQKIINKDIMLLQATSPIRNNRNVLKAIKIFKKKKIAGIYSVNKISNNNLKSVTLDSNNKIQLLTKQNYLFSNSQILPTQYKLNGNFYIFKSKSFIEEKEIPIRNARGMIVSSNESIDIDTISDLRKVKNTKFFNKS